MSRENIRRTHQQPCISTQPYATTHPAPNRSRYSGRRTDRIWNNAATDDAAHAPRRTEPASGRLREARLGANHTTAAETRGHPTQTRLNRAAVHYAPNAPGTWYRYSHATRSDADATPTNATLQTLRNADCHTGNAFPPQSYEIHRLRETRPTLLTQRGTQPTQPEERYANSRGQTHWANSPNTRQRTFQRFYCYSPCAVRSRQYADNSVSRSAWTLYS
jgi:hypothetical protein